MFTWIQTRSGRKFDFSNPSLDQIDIGDIAWALSGLPRFVAQSDTLYTVAEHSLAISRAVPAGMAIEGLLHDAAEAYTGDIPAPLKQFLGDEFFRIEAAINKAIAEKFALTPEFMGVVKKYDSQALHIEAPSVFTKFPLIDAWHEAFKQPVTVAIIVSTDRKRLDIYNEFLLQFNMLKRN